MGKKAGIITCTVRKTTPETQRKARMQYVDWQGEDAEGHGEGKGKAM